MKKQALARVRFPFLDSAPETKTIYFAALKRAIQALEEKRFYDFARMYLETRG